MWFLFEVYTLNQSKTDSCKESFGCNLENGGDWHSFQPKDPVLQNFFTSQQWRPQLPLLGWPSRFSSQHKHAGLPHPIRRGGSCLQSEMVLGSVIMIKHAWLHIRRPGWQPSLWVKGGVGECLCLYDYCASGEAQQVPHKPGSSVWWAIKLAEPESSKPGSMSACHQLGPQARWAK